MKRKALKTKVKTSKGKGALQSELRLGFKSATIGAAPTETKTDTNKTGCSQKHTNYGTINANTHTNQTKGHGKHESGAQDKHRLRWTTKSSHLERYVPTKETVSASRTTAKLDLTTNAASKNKHAMRANRKRDKCKQGRNTSGFDGQNAD